MNSGQRESLTQRVRPFHYMVINRYTNKVLHQSRDLEPAEAFYEEEIDRNLEDCIEMVAVLRHSGENRS